MTPYSRTQDVTPYSVPYSPQGGGLERFHPLENTQPIRKRLNLPLDAVILFTVRNLVPRMGLENLVAAMNRVVRAAPDILLVIGGDGPLKKDLETLAAKFGITRNLRFTGFIDETDLPDYYRTTDLFILPTKELEGFGLVTLETLASGTPVLGTPVGGAREIIGELDTGFLFKGTDPESMADLITDTYRTIRFDPEDWRKKSMDCRWFSEQNYTWETHMVKLDHIIQIQQ